MMRRRLENYINISNKRYRLMADIDILRRQRAEYEPVIMSSAFGSVHGSGTSSPTENAAVNNLSFFEKIDAEIAAKQKELAEVEAELNFLNNYIDGIDDLRLQEVFRLRFTQGVSWANIAVQWFYAPSSWSLIQKMVYDYINNHEIL